MSVHVYGVVAATTQLPKESRGRRGAHLRVVTHGGLGAVVSDIDAQVPVRREDLLAHGHVLETLIEHDTVLPMRFGMALHDDAAVTSHVLRAEENRLAALLAEFEGLVQLTVKAYHDEAPALRYMLAQRPDIQALRDAMPNRPTAYGDNVRLGQAVVEALRVVEEHDAADIYDRLAPLAERIALEDTKEQGQVLKAAMLVRRDARSQTDQAVAQLSRVLPARLRLRYIGPQPPYAFMGDIVLAGEPVWA